MHEISHFRLQLGRPEHGWLPVRLEMNDHIIEESASYILNDPVSGWLDFFAYVLDPTGPTARVCLWLEPSGYAIDAVSSDPANKTFVIRVFFDTGFVPPMRDQPMQQEFEGTIHARLLISGLKLGLSRLLFGADGSQLDHWLRDQSLASYRQRFETLRRKHSGP